MPCPYGGWRSGFFINVEFAVYLRKCIMPKLVSQVSGSPIGSIDFQANDRPSNFIPYQIDLKTGKVSARSNSLISLINPPIDSNRDSWLEVAVKIKFDSKIEKVKFIIEYDKTPSGWTVNLGDSQSNNGYGGDASTQSRDAEMQIVNQNMTVFGNDYNTPAGGELTQGKVLNFARKNSRVELEVSNEKLAWDNKNGLKNTLKSPYLYALKNQSDATGALNSEIYAGFNRVISGPGNRIGSGASKVTILLNPIDYAINASSATITEGISGKTGVTFTVTRSGCTELASTIDYTIAGTATNASDYNNIGGTSGATGATGTINFAAGETSKTITLDILGDVAIEPNETINVRLSNPSGLDATPTTIAAVAAITVINDDSAGISIDPAGFIAPAAVKKGNFTVQQKSELNDDFFGDWSNPNLVEGKGAIAVFIC
ncbi:MAG: hypothetical protein HC942_05275 [Microcoleus sp. SU_5_6]|nr:hypothetical protein [Microcoleus sp. SU_5_6]